MSLYLQSLKQNILFIVIIYIFLILYIIKKNNIVLKTLYKLQKNIT